MAFPWIEDDVASNVTFHQQLNFGELGTIESDRDGGLTLSGVRVCIETSENDPGLARFDRFGHNHRGSAATTGADASHMNRLFRPVFKLELILGLGGTGDRTKIVTR